MMICPQMGEEEEEKAKRDALKKGCIITYPSNEEKEKWENAVSPIYDTLSEENTKIVEIIKSLDE